MFGFWYGMFWYFLNCCVEFLITDLPDGKNGSKKIKLEIMI